jgi:hypothetical protein
MQSAEKLIVWIAVTAAFSAFLFAAHEASWVGKATIPLDFLILDASTGKPIAGASISLLRGRSEYAATSGPDGRATIVITATIGGRSSIFRRTRSVNYSWEIAINADEYEPVHDALQTFTRDRRYHSEPAPPTIVVRLEPMSVAEQ